MFVSLVKNHLWTCWMQDLFYPDAVVGWHSLECKTSNECFAERHDGFAWAVDHTARDVYRCDQDGVWRKSGKTEHNSIISFRKIRWEWECWSSDTIHWRPMVRTGNACLATGCRCRKLCDWRDCNTYVIFIIGPRSSVGLFVSSLPLIDFKTHESPFIFAHSTVEISPSSSDAFRSLRFFEPGTYRPGVPNCLNATCQNYLFFFSSIPWKMFYIIHREWPTCGSQWNYHNFIVQSM